MNLMLFLIIIFLLLLFYYINFIISLYRGIKKAALLKKTNDKEDFVSIIIPFRNEKDNLIKSLKSVTSQSYPKNRYEVIYIDDNSNDESSSIIMNWQGDENIRLLKSPYSNSDKAHKKKAMNYALGESRGEIIITTDADCYHGKDWLSEMVSCFDKQTGFVSGPVKFDGKSDFFDRIQELEFSSLILVGAGLIGNNSPIICNAANSGFRKSIFQQVGGYQDNLNISSGDDEFLMQKIARETTYNVKFCYSRDAVSFTSPNKTISQFYNQRKRWASKGFYYKDWKIILKLVLIFLFYLGIPIQIVLGVFYENFFLYSALISFISKFYFEYRFIHSEFNTLFDKPGFMLFLASELLHIPYIITAGISGLFGNYQWKGRKIKR